MPKNNKRRNQLVVYALVVVLVGAILAVIVFICMRLSRLAKTISSSPTVTNENPGMSYCRDNEDSAGEYRPSEMFPCQVDDTRDTLSFGLNLQDLKPGDLLLSAKLYNDADVIENDELQNSLWSSAGRPSRPMSLKRDSIGSKLRRALNPGVHLERLMHRVAGRKRPSHSAMIARVETNASGEVTMDTVTVWDFVVSTRWKAMTLKEYMFQSGASRRIHWILNLNQHASPSRINLVEYYLKNLSAAQSKYNFTGMLNSSLFDASNPLATVVDRRLFYERIGSRLFGESVSSRPRWMAAPESIRVSEKISNDASTLASNYEHLGSEGRSTIVSYAVKTAETGAWKSMLESDGFVCSSFFYAILESCGLVLPLSEYSLLHVHSNGTDTEAKSIPPRLVAYGLVHIDQKVVDDSTFTPGDTNNHRAMSIINPHFIHPVHYLRADFQWNASVWVSRASRFWIQAPNIT
jgi:hypothetical protein